MRHPPIGNLSWWHRLRGWRDVRCGCCGTICGNERPGGASAAWCGDCSSIYALAAIL